MELLCLQQAVMILNMNFKLVYQAVVVLLVNGLNLLFASKVIVDVNLIVKIK